MGSSEEEIKESADFDEFPQRQVYVDAYYIDKFEVTNVQYKLFVDSLHIKPPSYWIDGNYPIGWDGYPVVGISWDEARHYAAFVHKRLPTEEEWEKAARGTDGRKYPWGNSFDNKKCNNGSSGLAPVGGYPEGKSPYGVFDMAGNAAEWVDAWYSPYPRKDGDNFDRDTAEYKPNYGNQKYRVYRGGSWNSYGKFLRCANREKTKSSKKWRNIGFRCASDAKSEAP